jgi:PBP1b-binding outer membrane lipoprotein LpoB
MKRIFELLILIIILTSCSESFDIKDPAEFNKKIEKRTDIETAEQLIEIYYNYPPNEGTPKLDIKSRELDNGLIEVTLIHDGQEDDSQRATKIVMTAELNNKKWIVHQIKTNRKCWDGRGHTNWGTEWCN